MKGIKRPIPTKLYESCIADYQELEISWMLIPKATEFFGRLHMDIERLLPVTFLGFWYYLLIKNDAYRMIFMLLIKTKKEVYDKLVDFQTWIENRINQKIKYIYSKGGLRSNVFDTWFKATNIQWEPLGSYTL